MGKFPASRHKHVSPVVVSAPILNPNIESGATLLRESVGIFIWNIGEKLDRLTWALKFPAVRGVAAVLVTHVENASKRAQS